MVLGSTALSVLKSHVQVYANNVPVFEYARPFGSYGRAGPWPRHVTPSSFDTTTRCAVHEAMLPSGRPTSSTAWSDRTPPPVFDVHVTPPSVLVMTPFPFWRSQRSFPAVSITGPRTGPSNTFSHVVPASVERYTPEPGPLYEPTRNVLASIT